MCRLLAEREEPVGRRRRIAWDGVLQTGSGLENYLAGRGLKVPAGLADVFASDLPQRLSELLYQPAGDGPERSMVWAERTIDDSDWPLPPNLVPLLPVDEQSFACVVASDRDGERLPGEGAVVRWHLGIDREELQAALLDTDCFAYVESVADEIDAREVGLDRMLNQVGPAYMASHISKDKRPRTHVLRPVRIACQNVIVALAAIAQEASIDGLSVLAWQTCEVPHVAAHEANRALTVITLCDAFQSGGTMEIRFDGQASVTVDGQTYRYDDGHPERAVPASLRRFARTVGVTVGAEDPAAISPTEARALFMAVTPMPDELRGRVDRAASRHGIKPERLCYAMLKPIWRDVELDWLLATSARVGSILEAKTDWRDRSARQAEAEVCRTALMAGMLFRRLNATDAAAADGDARVVEDRRRGVTWSVQADIGAIRFDGVDADGPLPWCSRPTVAQSGSVLVAFRTIVTSDGVAALTERAQDQHVTAVLAVPRGADVPDGTKDRVAVAFCPDRLADLDKSVEANLTSARISRA